MGRLWSAGLRASIGLATLLDQPADAQAPVAVGSDFQVNTFTTSSQYLPEVGLDNDGDFVVVWQSDGQDGSLYGVFARRYSSAGTASGAAFQVNVQTVSVQGIPRIALDADGDFVIAWQGLDGDDAGVWARRFNS